MLVSLQKGSFFNCIHLTPEHINSKSSVKFALPLNLIDCSLVFFIKNRPELQKFILKEKI